MLEPSITVTNIDETVGLNSSNPSDNRLNILCPVISPSGPLQLTQVSGPSEFKRLYFGGRGVSANDDVTAVFARSLVSQAPLWIKRCARNTMRGGISSGSGSPIYVDENLNILTGSKVTIESPDATTVATAFGNWASSNAGYIRTNNTVYTKNEAPEEQFVKNTSEKTIRRLIRFAGDTENGTVGMVTLTVGDTRIQLDAGQRNLDELLAYLVQSEAYPQYFTGTGSLSDQEGTDLPTNVTEIGWVAPLGVTVVCEDSSDETAFVVSTPSGTTVNMFTLKTEEENTETWELTNPNIEFSAGGTLYAYYSGEYTGEATVKTRVTTSATPTYSEFMEGLVHYLASDFHADTASDSEIILPASITTVEGSGVEVSTEEINTVSESERFAIIARFPSETPLMSMSLSMADRENSVYSLVVSYQDIEEEWNFGFDASLVDGYGNSLYYDRVNNNSELVYIMELNGDSVSPGMSTVFGDEVTSAYSNVEDVISALESIPENDEASSTFDYICDGGIINSTLSSVIFNLCETYHSFYPVTAPITSNIDTLISMRTSLGSNYRGNLVNVAQRASTVDGGVVQLPGSYWYLVRRIELGNTSQEFMAIFGPSNGSLGITNPIYTYKMSDREELLDYQIPSMKRDPTTGYYLNDNPTLYETDSYLQEDGIVLMVDKVNQVADAYGRTLIGKYHTRALERIVQEELGLQLQNRLRVGTDNGPLSVTVVCDTSNNPVSLINQRKIRIDVYATFSRSIRDVLIYTAIMPTGE